MSDREPMNLMADCAARADEVDDYFVWAGADEDLFAPDHPPVLYDWKTEGLFAKERSAAAGIVVVAGLATFGLSAALGWVAQVVAS